MWIAHKSNVSYMYSIRNLDEKRIISRSLKHHRIIFYKQHLIKPIYHYYCLIDLLVIIVIT